MASEDIFAELSEEEISTEQDVIIPEHISPSSNGHHEHHEPQIAKAASEVNDGGHKLLQLPLNRIRTIMKLDPDTQVISQEIVFMVARATELFIEAIARESSAFTLHAKRKVVQKADFDLAISANDSLMFLDGAMDF